MSDASLTPPSDLAAGSAAAPVQAASNPYYVDALLYPIDSAVSVWNRSTTPLTLTYRFETSMPTDRSWSAATNFSGLSDTKKAAVRTALAQYAEVANVTFAELSASATEDADISIGQATLSYGGYTQFFYRYQTSGGVVTSQELDSLVVYSDTASLTDTYGKNLVLHELGHALMLKHPGNYDAAGSSPPAPYLPTAEDNNQYTVMSYIDNPNNGAESEALMLYDIAAVQARFGANTTTRSGDTIYSAFTTNVYTVWDADGTDTFDFASYASNLVIDLRAGAYSSVGGVSNIAIAYGVTVENANGGSGGDLLRGNGVANRMDGGSGNDTLEGGGGNDTLIGSAGNDYGSLGDGGSTAFVSGLETLVGGTGADDVQLADGGNHLLLAALETVRGGTGGDWVELGNRGNTLRLSGIETLTGGANTDVVTLADGGQSLVLVGIEALTGGIGGDWATLGNRGNTIALSGVETLSGGTGGDWVTLGAGGQTLVLVGIETLVGGAGADWATLGNRGNTTVVSGVETLLGGTGSDWVTLGDAGGTLVLTAIETLVGGAGADRVTLGNRGNTLVVAAVETLVGGSSGDWVMLGNRGNTVTLSGVETLAGGTGNDLVILDGVGQTLVLVGIETLQGGSGDDIVRLGHRGSTMTVTNVEALTGGNGIDAVTVAEGRVRFEGGTGADRITLLSGGGSDRIMFGSVDDGATGGATTGYDEVGNFQAGTDTIYITGGLRTAVDHDNNGQLSATDRTTGATNLATDELVRLTNTVTALADADYVSFRAAFGKVLTNERPQNVLVLASDGANSGLYLVSDGGDGTIAANEVRLIARFAGDAPLSGDIWLA